jgi:hypothetical protein
MRVPGYEHRTFRCSACGDIEQRLVFTRHAGSSHSKPVSVRVPPISRAPTSHNNRITASGILRRVFAKWHSACHTVGRRLLLSHAAAPRFTEAVSVAAPRDISAPPAEPVSAPPAEPVSAPPLELVSTPKTPPASLRSVKGASVSTAAPTSVSSETEHDLDVCEVLLKRAIKMVRGPTRSSQTATSVTKTASGTPSGLVSSMRAERPQASRIAVQIDYDPQKAKYVAKDAKSGFSILRHQDSARLRAMCDQMGWHVVDGAVAATGD